MQNEIESSITKVATEVLVADAIGKKWYKSKTVWTNILVVMALLLQIKTGFIVTPEFQALGLAFINLGLRKITKEEVIW